MENFVLPYLEWEILREPVAIYKVADRTELPKGQKRIMINRDEDYNLKATLHFKDPEFDRHFQRLSDVAGSFPETFDIQGSHSDLIHYTLESCLIGGITIHLVQEGPEILDTANLYFQGLRKRYKTGKEDTHLMEWFLNGPQDSVFHRSTKRKLSKSFFRRRLASKEDKIDSIEVSRDSSSIRSDFLRIKACDMQFLIVKVPKGIGPEWSSNIGIEYRKAWGRIPDRDERKKIEELCSFVFGRQLLSVGYTAYDQNENMVEAYAHNPWGNEAKSLCSKYDAPPVRIDNPIRGKAEDVIVQLLPKYYERQETLFLKEALWHYWISRNVPVGTNLSIISAAVETIINRWYRFKESKSGGVYMQKSKFETLLKEEIDGIKRKLASEPEGEKIVAKILRAYDFGITERFRIFFEEIKLSIDEQEWKAIKERHKFAHGHIEFGKTDWNRVIQHYNTFETLLHKILLKLLGYSGTYIDRSVSGWKDKEIV